MTLEIINKDIDKFIKSLPNYFITDENISIIRHNLVYGLNILSNGIYNHLKYNKNINPYIKQCKTSFSRNKNIWYSDEFQDVIYYLDTAYDFIDQIKEILKCQK